VLPAPLAGIRGASTRATPPRETFRIAVPDGHAAAAHRRRARGRRHRLPEGYDADSADRYPDSGRDDVEVKVMRPQDMPRAVALGQFDLAITVVTGCASSAPLPRAPVVGALRPATLEVPLGAVVTEDLPVETIQEAIAYWRRDDPDRPSASPPST
jgi:hypothetical protein